MSEELKFIPLTQNKLAKVDTEDYDYLSQWNWYYDKGYATTKITENGKRERIYMHRLLLTPKNNYRVDHINGDTTDNRKSNLRLCTVSQNSMNSKPRKGYSLYKGVSFDKKSNKWYAQIMHNYKNYYLGRFDTDIEAAKAYNKKALELFGEFSRLNEV